MNKDKKLVPKLRFPEFVKDGEWEEKKLGDYLFQNPEYGINAPGVPYSNQLPTYLRITDISEDGRFLANGKVSVDSDVTENNYLCDGDIVLARTGASVGKSYKYRSEDGRLVFAGFLIRVKTNNFKLNSDFLFQFLSTDQYWKWVSFISARSGQPGINGTEYSSMPIRLPQTINEQQKIASCLSSLDEVIAAHREKLDLLKDHKKGLMQNLFPQEGEKVPKYRFPEFVKDGEWEVKKIGDYIDLLSGIALRSEELSDDKIGTPILRGINITEGYIRHSEDIDKYFLGNLENLGKYLIKEDDIVIGMDGSKVGKNVALINKDDENSILIQRVARIRPNERSDIKYIYQYFLSDKFRTYVDTVNTSSGIPHISAQQIKDFKVGFPPKLKEQQKIASCLSALDALITAQAEKIEQLKQHKKGLMQGLFPKMND
ncbi:restriction endonuclease subunit S [Chitinophaga sp.]|uniref:restriction endonuclease subunit S n=1 Tax=Chitinophaga sp. TaxID=1869181 RepID=UPI002F921C0D